MKKGFTMIELIFVIVILGVLASVAIPRLAATRDDAEVAKAATNLATAISDITAYYTAKGTFDSNAANNMQTMTNALTTTGQLMMKNKECAKVTLPTITTSTDKVELKIEFTGTSNDAACATLKGLSSVKQMCGNQMTSSGKCTIQIGGSGGIAW